MGVPGRSPRGLRLLACWLVLTVTTALGLLVAPPPSVAVTAAPALIATPAGTIAGEPVALEGSLPPRRSRPVVLQRLRGTTWVAVARQDSGGTGAFRFPLTTPGRATTYRVLAPRVSLGSRTYAATRTARRTITPTAQAGDLTLPGTASVGDTLTATATFQPARAGRPVILQRDQGGSWVQVAPAAQDASGQAVFPVQPDQPGTFRYRALTPTANGAAASTSPVREVVVTVTAGPPLVSGISGNGRYFVDQTGRPILVKGDSPWSILLDASPAEMDQYVATRQRQGFNAVLLSLLGNIGNGGPSDAGATFDGLLPFDGAPDRLDPAYWDRVAAFLGKCRDAGITVMAYPLDGWAGTADYNGLAKDWTTDQARAYGAAVAARLKGFDNVIWSVGGDFPAGGNDAVDARFAAVLDGLAAGGMDRPSTIQFTLNSTSLSSDFWKNRVDFSFVYSYAATYTMVEEAYQQLTPAGAHLPALLGETFYDGTGGVTDLFLRSQVAWALTSGAPGDFYGQASVWQNPPTTATLETPGAAQVSALRRTFEGLRGWQDLVPDLGSGFITSGRGTHGVAAGEYLSGDTYVTGAVTPDGTLGVVYLPDASRPITLDPSRLGSGVTARWVDPADGSSTPAAWTGDPGTAFSRPVPNADGGPDWLLVLEAATPR